MQKEMAMKWCEALRSGRYQYGKGVLRSKSNKYCSLGVLCDISGLGSWTVIKGNYYVFKDHEGDCVDAGLSEYIMYNLGVNDSLGGFNVVFHKVSKHIGSLAEANDSDFDFDESANFIENNYKEL